MKPSSAPWDFRYAPVSTLVAGDAPNHVDVVVATGARVPETTLRQALQCLAPDARVETLIARAPLHWSRIRFGGEASDRDVAEALLRRGVAVRYVSSALSGSLKVAPALDLARSSRARATDWIARRPSRPRESGTAGGRWFLGESGVQVERAVCGTGAGTRLAIIDDDVADLEFVDLERTCHVGIDAPSRATGHAALLAAWATGARRADGTRYLGVAPDASVRAYVIPKPGVDVFSLPLAIAQAACAGADVIVCATYVEGTTSPMLDDALDVATKLGRRGRGTLVVFPTGRETSSPNGSVHASLSLALGDPACDPRVHCVAPSGIEGGWFLWRAPHGRLRPFANRGPAVRWLAPGDDITYPFAARELKFHAESSGAAAIAAGVMALVISRNPRLHAREVHALLLRTATPPRPRQVAENELADPADVLPLGRDPDGHDAKCGYGRLDATRACASASDPVALELDAMGEWEAARRWHVRTEKPYSRHLARWLVRRLLARPDVEHAVRVLLRHLRLVSAAPARRPTHPPESLIRQASLLVRELSRQAKTPAPLREELHGMLRRLQSAADGPHAEGAVNPWTVGVFEPHSPLDASDPSPEAFSDAAFRA